MRNTILAVAVVIFGCSLALGQVQERVLYSFGGSPRDGILPNSTLVADRDGNLFGTTTTGGAQGTCYGNGCGIVFELSRNPDDTWTESIIYNFCAGHSGFDCPDGATGSGLVIDSAGNLYGVRTDGGGTGTGVAFELSPPSMRGGTWTYTLLYTFCSVSNCQDGWGPSGTLLIDSAGNLYGTTGAGGTADGGVIFELSLDAGVWNETVLYDFCMFGQDGICPDGENPRSGVVFDNVGNLLGTTWYGGSSDLSGGGTVFKLSPRFGGWVETVLYAKPGSNSIGLGPISFDHIGNMYSTFTPPVGNGNGGVGRLNIHGRVDTYLFNGNDGKDPVGGMLVDGQRRLLYGVTSGGPVGRGNIFQIDATGREGLVYAFCTQPDCADGYQPLGGLIEDKLGNLFGTTSFGGANQEGVVFEITP